MNGEIKTDALSKFYKKNFEEKMGALVDAGVLTRDQAGQWVDGHFDLDFEIGDHMIENYIGSFELPLGLAMNFVIDGEPVVIPMAIEEPSVVAAASNAAKIMGQAGGFQTTVHSQLKIGQVAFENPQDAKAAKERILAQRDEILALANQSQPSILNYSDGAVNLEVRIIPADLDFETPEFLVVHLWVDTDQAMGANTMNTMLEGIAPYLETLVGSGHLMSILSNYATESIFEARCQVAPEHLGTEHYTGEEVRDRIIAATKFATADPYRAVTHNKGLMNGVDPVVIASGNDWRAVEAGIHAYASKSGQYRSVTQWTSDADGNLVGSVKLPLALGAVGGAVGVHPTVQFARIIMGEPDVTRLSQIIASVGLAQNFAAVRALVTDGIQKGHMSLHAQSLAISAGARGDEIRIVTNHLKQADHMTTEIAKDVLADLRAGKNHI